MRRKLMLTAAVLAALVLMGSVTAPASAQGWGWGYPGGYYGMGAHDFMPHWHSVVTPYGSYGYYGLGLHDFLPHYHSYAYPGLGGYSPYGYGGASVGYYSPAPFYSIYSFYNNPFYFGY